MTVCTACGEDNPQIARFCLACGRPFAGDGAAPREERRVVTIIFVDLVEFTARAERLDPEDVRAILSPYHDRVRSEIESFGGVVEKFIGDAVMGVFGAPTAYGDDIERAVRAAIAVREGIDETNTDDRALDLRVRIAVHTGEALVTVGARPELGEAMVAGDVVNTAARLQSAAPPGGVLVGAETYAATRQAVVYERAESVSAKGKSEAVEAWHAIRMAGPGETAVHSTPLIGRTGELDLLRAAWERATARRAPHLVTVLGPPGIGKSRLGSEFRLMVKEMGGRSVVGRCLPYRESSAYFAFAVQVRHLAGIFESDPMEVGLRKLRATVQTLGAVDVDSVAEHLGILLGLDSAGSVADRESLFFSVRCFIEAVAKEQPAAFIFEDIHWGDADLLDLIEQLAARLHDLPVLLLTLARPELLDVRPGWGGGLPAYTALPLQPLEDGDAHRLATLLLVGVDEDERDSRAAQLATTAEGNPLFIQQLAAAVSERSTAIADTLPATVRGIVTARLDALPAAERSLLLDAAVVGKVFWRGAVAHVTEEAERLPELLARLERRDLIRRETVSAIEGDQQFAFQHLLIRDIAYEMLPRARRRERHRQAAQFWEERTEEVGEAAGQIARHWREAGESARAIPYFVTAAEHAGRGWAKLRSVALYQEALELAPEGDDELRLDLQRRIAMAWILVVHLRDVERPAEESEGYTSG